MGPLGDRYGRTFALGCLSTFKQAGYLVPHHPGGAVRFRTSCTVRRGCCRFGSSHERLLGSYPLWKLGGHLRRRHHYVWTVVLLLQCCVATLLHRDVPTAVRSTGLALGTQIGFVVSHGFVPVIASWIAGGAGDNWAGVRIFVTVVCVLAAGAALTAKEITPLNLDEIDALHLERTEQDDLVRSRANVEKRQTSVVVE